MSVKLYCTAGMLVLSELLPYLPVQGNGIVQTTLTALNRLQLLPDNEYARMRRNYTAVPEVAATPSCSAEKPAAVLEKDETVIEIRVNRKKV
jgi:hypothetical protein